MAFDGVTWNEALPDNSTLAHQIDDYEKDHKIAVRSRLANEHVFSSTSTSTGDAGHHKYITFQQQTGAVALSTAITQVGALYVGSSAAGYPLTYENSAGVLTYIAGTTYGIMQTLYPVGSIYISTLSTNPNTLLGFGTWEAFATGRVLLGAGTSDATYTAGSTGGTSTHTLITAEMPAHTHSVETWGDSGAAGNKVYRTGSPNVQVDVAAAALSTGGGGAHNNMPPYVVIYIWKRTA
jgi:hypothetical protein